MEVCVFLFNIDIPHETQSNLRTDSDWPDKAIKNLGVPSEYKLNARYINVMTDHTMENSWEN